MTVGTSSTTPGPKGPGWSSAKGAATRLARGTSGATPRKVVRRTARALGGGAGGAGGSWSPGSTRAAQRFAGLLGGAVQEGFIEAARQLEIGDLEGRPIGEAIMDILDWVADDAVDLDDQSARRAAGAILSGLARDGVDLDQPLELDEGAALFRDFLVEYLIRTIITPLEKRLTENASATQSRKHEQDIARVVKALVHLDISAEQFSTIDWLGPEGAAVFERIRKDAIDVLAGDGP